jgi:hypothetical protein
LLVFLYRADTSGVTSKTVVPGWDDLILCSELSSLDSLKELSLSEDHQAQFYDKSAADPKRSKVTGSWSFDQASKRYSVKLNGAATDYILVSPENAEGCMLIKGSLDSANLRESWFSVEIDQTNGEDRPGY